MQIDIFKNKKFFPSGTLVVGVDIGKALHYARGITNRCEYISKPFRFGNRRGEMEKFMRQIEKWLRETGCNDVVVGMEPTGPYWKPLDAYLEGKEIRVVLVNPSHTKKSKELYDNSPGKDDKKDALLIARMVDEGKYLEKTIKTEEEESLCELLEYRDSLVKRNVCLKNQILSKLDEYFPEFSDVFKSVDGKTALALLQIAPLPCDILAMGEGTLANLMRENSRGAMGCEKARSLMELALDSIGKRKGKEAARVVMKGYALDLERTLASIEEVESQMKELLKDMPVHKILDTIPSVSTVTIAAVISTVGDMRHFSSAKEILKHLGLNVYVVQSGKYRGERHISKRGCSLARKLLYCVIPNLIRPGGLFYDKYQEMKKRGMHFKKICVALVCRLVKMMFALVRDGRAFECEYKPKHHFRYGKAERIELVHLRALAA